MLFAEIEGAENEIGASAADGTHTKKHYTSGDFLLCARNCLDTFNSMDDNEKFLAFDTVKIECLHSHKKRREMSDLVLKGVKFKKKIEFYSNFPGLIKLQ